MTKIFYSFIPGELGKAVRGLYLPMAEAATAAVKEAGDQAKREARADIASAGFSRGVQNSLRVDYYPSRAGVTSINAAANVYHKIFYLGVFEEGDTITSSKLMWLPLPTTPKPRRGNALQAVSKASPEKLQFFKGRSGTPLLAVQVRLSGSKARERTPKLSMAAIKRGRNGKGVLRTIPVFHGVRSVKMPDKLNIRQIIERARSRLAELYVKNLKGD